MKWILGILFFLLVVINPMIIGFYHTLLTEFVAITFSVIGCYIAWKWMNTNFIENKLKYSIYTIIISILVAIAWLLKQPYVGIILFPFIIASFIAIVRNTNLKNIIQRLISVGICGIVLVISISVWNIVLEKNNVQVKQNRTSSGFFAIGILNGLSEYDVQKNERFDTIEEVEKEEKITPEDKEKILQIINNKSDYKSYTVMDVKKEYYKIIYSKEEVISTMESAEFLFNSLINDFGTVIKGYFSNYLATISIYDIRFDVMDIIIEKNINLLDNVEIKAIAYKIYGYGNGNVFPLSEELAPYAEPYIGTNKPIVAINWGMRKLQIPANIAMKISYILLPILVIISIIGVFKTRKRYTEKYCKIIDMITILFTYSILHILVHSILGSTIDRYTVPALATTFIGILLSIYAIVYRKKYKID